MNYRPHNRTIRNEDDYLDAVAWVRTIVSAFTEDWIEKHGDMPDLDDFIELNPVYDHEELYDEIKKEIERVAELVLAERCREI